MSRTPSSANGRGRPPATQQAIVRRLRDAIVGGRVRPGERLPTHRELRERFKTGPGPVQAALDRLRAEGWVQARTGDGTYVAERLPHWTRYALLLSEPAAPQAGVESLFVKAYTQSAAAITAEGPRQISIVHGRRGAMEGDEVERLFADCREHRLAGLILAAHPLWFWAMQEKSLWAKGVYRVAITGDAVPPYVPGVDLSLARFAERAAGYLRGRGRRRVAVIGPPYGDTRADILREAMDRAGLVVRPHWLHYADPRAASSTIPLVQVLMRLPGADRPDALVLTDDHFAVPVTTALREAGKLVPDEVEVVSMANFPVLPETAAPVRWLGPDSRAVLEKSCDIIDVQRRGEKVMSNALVEPVFEEEWRRGEKSES